MNNIVSVWVKIWLYVVALVGIIHVVILLTNWDQYDWITRSIFLTIIITAAHVWEEQRYPGGFPFFFNTLLKSKTPLWYPMNEFLDSMTVSGVLLAFIGFLVFGEGQAWMGVSLIIFCFVELFAHTLGGYIIFKKFKHKGKRTIYSPGHATTVFGFVPIAIGVLYYLIENGLSTGSNWLYGFGAMFLILAICIGVFEKLFESKTSPYVFSKNYGIGYFRKFLTPAELTAAINGAE